MPTNVALFSRSANFILKKTITPKIISNLIFRDGQPARLFALRHCVVVTIVYFFIVDIIA